MLRDHRAQVVSDLLLRGLHSVDVVESQVRVLEDLFHPAPVGMADRRERTEQARDAIGASRGEIACGVAQGREVHVLYRLAREAIHLRDSESPPKRS